MASYCLAPHKTPVLSQPSILMDRAAMPYQSAMKAPLLLSLLALSLLYPFADASCRQTCASGPACKECGPEPEAILHQRLKRQGSWTSRGEKFAGFAKEFISVFGESGLKIKSVMGIANKLGPMLGPVGPVFAIIGLWTESQTSLDDVKEAMTRGFQEIKRHLHEVNVKLDKIYKLLLESSQFQMVEMDRSLLNGIEEAVTKAVEFPEQSTSNALCRYCQQAGKAPVDILRRLDEYVHKDWLPPQLKDALFSYAAGSSGKMALVTKQFLADIIRATLFKQTCLGNEGASEALKNRTSIEDQATFEKLAATFLDWEKALAPEWAVNGKWQTDTAKFIQAAKSWVPFTPVSSYLEARARNILENFYAHEYNYWGNNSASGKPGTGDVRFSVTIITANPANKIEILNPHRAILLTDNLGGHDVQIVVTWNGYEQTLDSVRARVESANAAFGKLFNPRAYGVKKGEKWYQCFTNHATIGKVVHGDFDNAIMDADVSAVAVVAEGETVVSEVHPFTVPDKKSGIDGSVYFGYACEGASNDEEKSTVVIMV